MADAQDIKIFNIAKIIITTVITVIIIWDQSYVLQEACQYCCLAELLYLAGQPRPYLCKSRTCPDTSLAYLPVLLLQQKMPRNWICQILIPASKLKSDDARVYFVYKRVYFKFVLLFSSHWSTWFRYQIPDGITSHSIWAKLAVNFIEW